MPFLAFEIEVRRVTPEENSRVAALPFLVLTTGTPSCALRAFRSQNPQISREGCANSR